MNETTELILAQFNKKKVHAETHELGGGDEIDALKLKNIGSITAKTISDPVTSSMIANGAVGIDQLNPTLITDVNNVAVQAEFDRRAVNVQKYGAVGDGVTDDSNAIQSAFDAVRHETGSKLKLYFPKGTYRITKPIIGHRVNIFAEGNVIISHDGPVAYFDFKPIDPATINEFYELFIEGIGFRGKNGATTGIKINRGSQFYLEKIYLYDFTQTAIELNDCTIGNFVRPTVSNCGTAFLLNGVAGVSWMHGDIYANQADFKFVNYNSGIKILDNWSEDSAATFLFDSTSARSNVGGLYITNCFFGRNNSPGGPLFKFLSPNTTNLVTAQNIVFENNRVNFAISGLENMVDINLTGSNTSSIINLAVRDNFLYNELSPNAYFAKTVGSALDQVRILYEDNTTSGTVNILDGTGRVVGIDRSGTSLTQYHKVRGELILERPANSTGIEGAFSWENTVKLPRFTDGVQYRNVQGIHTGATGSRPAGVPVGYQYYDATLFKPIWWSGSAWKDATGTNV